MSFIIALHDDKICIHGVSMNFEELRTVSAEHNITLTDEMIAQLERYAVLLQEWNEKINLTAIKEPAAVVEKHFCDCLMPLSSGLIRGKTADIGSGAGFPGLVWKIADPSLSVVLVEPTGKRCRFLSTVIDDLNLTDIHVVNLRSEEYVKDARSSFDTVTARAVAELRLLSELCIPLVKKGGIFAAMKGPGGEAEAEEAAHALKVLGASVDSIQKITLPSGDERTNLFFRKVSDTPEQYPRNYGRMKKKPL